MAVVWRHSTSSRKEGLADVFHQPLRPFTTTSLHAVASSPASPSIRLSACPARWQPA